MYTYQATIERVVDGDTLDVLIDLGFDIHIRQRLRLYGINTPESRTKDLQEKARGLATKAFVHDWSLTNNKVYVKTIKDATEKYGRILAYVYPDVEMRLSLNEQLVDAGHAVPYFGGKRD